MQRLLRVRGDAFRLVAAGRHRPVGVPEAWAYAGAPAAGPRTRAGSARARPGL